MFKKLFSFFNKEDDENVEDTYKKVQRSTRIFRIINEEVQEIQRYNFDETRFKGNFSSCYVESISTNNPSDIFFYLKQLSNNVEAIQIEFDEYMDNSKIEIAIEIFPKYENQQLSLPSYFKLSEYYYDIQINPEDYIKFIDLLEDIKVPDYLPFELNYCIEDFMGHLVTLSKSPNSPLYIVWDVDDLEDFVILVELGKSKEKIKLSLKNDKIYLVDASEIYKRVTLKQQNV